jgi:hypothetical protein
MHLIQKPITALPQLLIKMAILMTVLVLLLGLMLEKFFSLAH